MRFTRGIISILNILIMSLFAFILYKVLMKFLMWGNMKKQTSKDKVLPEVREIKSEGFERKSLYLVVYLKDKEGNPVSYQRIYQESYDKLMEIVGFVEEWYSGNNPAEKPRVKLNFSAFKDAGIRGNLTKRLTLLASWVELRERTPNGVWVVKYDKPLLLLQQKTKSTLKNRWGKKTPVNVFPNRDVYYDYDEGYDVYE